MRTRGWLAALVTIVAAGNWFLLRDESPEFARPGRVEAPSPPRPAAVAGPEPISRRVPPGQQSATPSPTRQTPRAWAQARERFARAERLATEVQGVLGAPTAAGLFHAWIAVLACDVPPPHREAAARHAHFAHAIERCRDVPLPSVFQQQAEIARLSEEDRDLIDALQGKGRHHDAPFAQRFASVGATEDPHALAHLLSAWLTGSEAMLDGRIVGGDDAAALMAAATLIACRSVNACESTPIALALCAEQHVCTGSHLDNMARLIGPPGFEQVQRYMTRIEEALRSGDYSGFR